MVRKYDNNGIQIGKNINFRENGSLEHEYDNEKEESTDYWLNGKPKFKFIENVSQSYHYLNGNFMEKYTHKTQKKGEYNVEYFNENGKVNIIRDGIKNTFTQWDEKGKLIEQEPL